MINITIHDEETGRSTTLRSDHAVVVTANDGAQDVDIAVCTAGESDLECDELLDAAQRALMHCETSLSAN